jgi:hypothetical protein
MKKQEQLLEVAMIAVILGDHFAEKLYLKMQERDTGYVSTAETIAQWSLAFYKKHKKTNWEQVLEDGLKPLSKEMSSVICYDDAIIDFGFYKLDKFE